MERACASRRYQFRASKAIGSSLFLRLGIRLYDELIAAVALSFHPSRMLDMISSPHVLLTGPSAGACTSLSRAMA